MRFVVYGHPAPGGSKRFVGKSKAGKAILAPASASTGVWRANVVQVMAKLLAEQGDPPPLDEALVLRMVFSFNRPKSAPRSKRPFMTVAPDVVKLARSTEDALTEVGFWVDDKLVVEYDRLAKVYCGEDPEALPREGVLIMVRSKVASVIVAPGRGPLELEAA